MTAWFPTAPNLGMHLKEVPCKTTVAPKESHSVTQAGDTLKKVAVLTKRNARIAAGHFVIVFRVTVSRKSGKDDILHWEKL